MNSLYAKIDVKRQFLQSSTANSVIQLLQVVRTTIQSNVLQTAIPMSALMRKDSEFGVYVLRRDEIFFDARPPYCYCTSDHNCSMPSAFYNIERGIQTEIHTEKYWTPLAEVSGVFAGCLPVESLLKSTLECLFDSSCLKTIRTFIPSSNITGVYALNTSQTQLVPNTSIEILINKLFIEKCSMEPSFSNYYAQCAPILCASTLSKGKNPLYILTKLLGLYGGLTAVLRFCISLIVPWWRKRRVIASVEPRPSEYRYLKRPRLILLKF